MERTSCVYKGNSTRVTYHTHWMSYVTWVVVWKYDGHTSWDRKAARRARREKKWYNFFLDDLESVTKFLISEHDNHALAKSFIDKNQRELKEQRELQSIIDGEL